MHLYRAFFLFSLLLLSYSCNCFALNFEEPELDIDLFLSTNREENQKLYIEPEMVYVAPNQILLNIGQHWLPVRQLRTDANGVYVSLGEVLTQAKKLGIWGETWTCPNPDCGYENYDRISHCAICGTKKPRPKK